MTERTRRKSLYLARESTYGTDPSSDGSGYVHVPVTSLEFVADEFVADDPDYHDGYNQPAQEQAIRDGWSLSFEVPFVGLPAAATAGVTPSAAFWLGYLLDHVLGAGAAIDGANVSASASTTVTPDADNQAPQDLLPVWESGLPSSAAARVQWRRMTSESGGVYTVDRAWDANPTTAADVLGAVTWIPDETGGGTGGSRGSVALLAREGDREYLLLGGRVTSATITAEINRVARLRLSVSGDTKTRVTLGANHTSRPAASATPAGVKLLLSPVTVNGSDLTVERVEIDLGIAAAEVPSSAAANGRAAFEGIEIRPRVTLTPTFSTDLEDLLRSRGAVPLAIQLGSGVVSGGVANGAAFWAEAAQVVEASAADRNGGIAHSVTLAVKNGGYFNGTSTRTRFCQLALI